MGKRKSTVKANEPVRPMSPLGLARGKGREVLLEDKLSTSFAIWAKWNQRGA